MSIDPNNLVAMVRERTTENQTVFKAGYDAGYRQGLFEGLVEAKKVVAETQKLIDSLKERFT